MIYLCPEVTRNVPVYANGNDDIVKAFLKIALSDKSYIE